MLVPTKMLLAQGMWLGHEKMLADHTDAHGRHTLTGEQVEDDHFQKLMESAARAYGLQCIWVWEDDMIPAWSEDGERWLFCVNMIWREMTPEMIEERIR